MLRFWLVLLLACSAVAAESAFAQLSKVGSLDARATGVAGSESATYKVFAEVLQAGSSGRKQLEEILVKGSPAGRLYAAMGIWNLDNQAGLKALQTLRNDPAEVIMTTGCFRETTTVGKVAAQLLEDHGNIRQFVPPDTK